jgi:polar amino acid transport system substrate-binding protein
MFSNLTWQRGWKMKRNILIFLILFFVICLSSCSLEREKTSIGEEEQNAISTESTEENIEKVLLVYDNIPPYIYYEDGEHKGIYVKIINEAFKNSDVEIELGRYPWSRCLEMIKSHKAFGSIGWVQTVERFDNSVFSNNFYLGVTNLYYMKDNEKIIKSYDKIHELSGLSFGATEPNYFISSLVGAGINPDLSIDSLDAIEKLIYGRYDVLVMDQGIFNYLLELHHSDKVDEIVSYQEPYIKAYHSIRVWHDNPRAKEILEIFDNGLGEVISSGKYDELLNEYNLVMSSDSLFKIQYENSPLRIGFTSFSPYEFLVGNEAKGINVDIVREALSRLGYGIDDYELVVYPWSRVLELVRKGDLDLVVDIILSEDRKKNFSFSREPIGVIDYRLISKSNSISSIELNQISELGDTVGLVREYKYSEEILRIIDEQNIEIVYVDESKELLNGLINDRYSFILEDIDTVNFYLKELKYDNEVFYFEKASYPSKAYIASSINKDYGDLISQIDEQISIIKKDGTYDRIRKKYLDRQE